MGGKTLVMAHEHSAGTMTLVQEVAPTYDPITNEYTNGSIEHYDCPTCGRHFVSEDGQFVSKTEAELALPYFVFRSTDIGGYRLCEVIGFNGTDANVVIPDNVPSNYPDEHQRGNTITAVDTYVFKDNSVLKSVTAGDYLTGINESAFENCISLKTVTVGSSLNSIGTDAFKGCAALESFSSTSKEVILYFYVEGDETLEPPRPSEYSFDKDTDVTFHGPHGSKLLEISNKYTNSSFVPTDEHVEPTWTWAPDYSSATATFNCNDTCELNGGTNAEFTANSELTVTNTRAVYTASVVVDGKTYTTELYEPTTLDAQVFGHTLTLEGVIGVNTYLVLGDDITDNTENYEVEFWNGDTLVSSTKVSEVTPQERPNTRATSLVYGFSMTTVAKEMGTKFTMKIKGPEGYIAFANSDGTTVDADTGLPYSINDYLDDRIAKSEDVNMVQLAKDMKAYGTYAKHYFDIRDNGSNGPLPTIDDFVTVTADDLPKYTVPENNGHFTYKGTTLTLESDTSFRMYFESDETSKLTITRNGVEGSLEIKSVEGGKLCYVEVPDIVAKDLDEVYEFTISDGYDSTTAKNYGPLGYANWALSTTDDAHENLRYVMMALYHYNQSANVYFKQ